MPLVQYRSVVRFGIVASLQCVVFSIVSACGARDEIKIELASNAERVDALPSFVHFEKPVYPQFAYLAMIEEVVWVEMLVGLNGFPREVVAVEDIHNLAEFQESAESAGRKCTFSPALLNGKPTEARIKFAFRFKISPEDRRRDAYRRRMGG